MDLLTPLLSLPPLPAALLAGVFGLLLGSFFNVIIYRTPLDESVAWPPSHCTKCGYRIKSYENIPVVSWLLLRGKCKSCGTGISLQYPLIEALTGLTAALLAGYWTSWGLEYPPDFKIGVSYLILASIPIFIVDFRHFLIPDSLTYAGMAFGLAGSLLAGGISLMPDSLGLFSLWENSGSLLGGIGAGLLLWSIGFFVSLLMKKEAMGLGDVKLLAMIGCLFGLKTALVGLMLAAVLGSLFGIPMLIMKKLGRDRHIPFGPFICMGALASALFGSQILNWYFGFLSHGF